VTDKKKDRGERIIQSPGLFTEEERASRGNRFEELATTGPAVDQFIAALPPEQADLVRNALKETAALLRNRVVNIQEIMSLEENRRSIIETLHSSMMKDRSGKGQFKPDGPDGD